MACIKSAGSNAENPHMQGFLVEAANIAAFLNRSAWVWHLFPNPANLVAGRFLDQTIPLGLQGSRIHGVDSIEVFDLLFSDVDRGFHHIPQHILGAWRR